MRIFLSPSNQVENGYIGVDTNECEVCYAIATKVKELFDNQAGYKVFLAEKYDKISTRISLSNALLTVSDLHICIHTNAGGGHGSEIFCSTKSKNNKYVLSMYDNISALTPSTDRGIKVNNNLVEIRKTVATCIYIEVDFHDTNGVWLSDNIDNIANAIFNSIINVDGTNKKLYKVQTGAFSNKNNAKLYCEKLREFGIECFIVEENK